MGGQGSGWGPELTPQCAVDVWSEQWHLSHFGACWLLLTVHKHWNIPGSMMEGPRAAGLPRFCSPDGMGETQKAAHAYLNQCQYMLSLICDLPQ